MAEKKGLEFSGVAKRVGDELPAGDVLVMRVIMKRDGWSVDLDATFAAMLETMPTSVQIGETMIEAVTKTVRMHTGQVQ